MFSRVSGRLAGAFALLLAIASPLPAAQPLPPGATLVPDPAVTYGTLPNGMRYALMQNGAPTGMVSIRLAMHVGSYDEEEGELGYAHFIEHMAYRSTRQAPNGGFDNRFASIGVALGRDQNASTSMDATVYRLDLPKADPAAMKMALEWTRGAADGILFTPAGVDLERGVVMSELQARNSPTAISQRETMRFQGRGLRSSLRDPGGTEESLRAATAPRLQAFYERWYRPENAMLVIVGDAPVEELRKLAESAFADWKGNGPVVARVRPSGEPAPRGLEALSQSHPALPSTVSACRFGPPDTETPGSLERMRREALSAVWTTVIGNRLNEAIARPGSPLLSAGMIVNHDLPDARAACLLVLPNNDKWHEALAEAQGELRRFARDGAGEAEIKIAVEELLSRLGGQLFQSGTRVTPVLAEQITGSYLESEVFQHPSAAMETFKLLVAGVTAEDLKKAFDEDWSGTGPLISATAASAPPKEALLAAWQENEAAAPLAAYARQAEASWAYWEFGKPGKIAKREVMTNPDFIRLHFRNGVVVNFKPTSLQSGGVEIRVRFGHGERGLDKATRVPAGIAASVFPMGGLGKMDFQQIASALTNTTWGFNLEVEATAFVLSSSTLSDQVEQQLRLLTAYMTDPAFGPAIDEKLPTVIDIGYRSYRADPNAVAVEALEKALFPDQLSMPPRAEIDAFRARDFERMLKPALTGAPIEVTIVGDIAEARVTKALATTFGALKRRPALAPSTGKGPFRYFPKTLPPPLTAYHEGPADKAAALLMWPLYVASPERRAEEYAIGLVSEIFQTRLIQQIRAGMGKTYSPNVANVMIDQADQGYVAAQIETSPADLDQVIAAARRIAADLAAGSISQEELEAARQPLIAARLQAQSRNEAWAGILSHSFRHPEAIEELTGYQRDVERLTLEDVRRAAAIWLGRDPIVSRALPATAAPTP